MYKIALVFIIIQVLNSYSPNYLIIKKKVFMVINHKAAKKKKKTLTFL